MYMESGKEKSEVVCCPDGQLYWKVESQITTMLCPIYGSGEVLYDGETLKVESFMLTFKVNDIKFNLN